MAIEIIESVKRPVIYTLTLKLDEDDYEMIQDARNALLDQTCYDDYLVDMLLTIMSGCK